MFRGVSAGVKLGGAGVGVALLGVFGLVQARRQDRDPLLPFVLFRDRNYALMSAANVIVSIGLVGMALPLTLYLQTQLCLALQPPRTQVPKNAKIPQADPAADLPAGQAAGEGLSGGSRHRSFGPNGTITGAGPAAGRGLSPDVTWIT